MASRGLNDLLENPGHHAYLILGDRRRHYRELRLLFREKIAAGKLEVADIWSHDCENLGIEDARTIKEIQNTKPVGERRVILLSFLSIQSEAQNSLLKLFEEPAGETIFFVCAGSAEIFLPTLLSRFYVFRPPAEKNNRGLEPGSGPSEESIKKFLAGGPQTRLAFLEPIIKGKDKNQAESFLDALESALFDVLGDGPAGGRKISAASRGEIFESIFSARHFLRGRAPSVKMILEHLSGIVPIIADVKK